VLQDIWTPAFSGVTEFLKLRELDRNSESRRWRHGNSSGKPVQAMKSARVSFVPVADLNNLGKQTLRNVELTGAVRLYRAASSDLRERG
jgi:hypothetical protein